VKEFCKLANICQSYERMYSGTFFETQCRLYADKCNTVQLKAVQRHTCRSEFNCEAHKNAPSCQISTKSDNQQLSYQASRFKTVFNLQRRQAPPTRPLADTASTWTEVT